MIEAVAGQALGGLAAYGIGQLLGPDGGPDYSNVTDQYNKRNSQISEFAQNLASARTKYLSSLNNMYNTAYARFSGNAEAGFAARGLQVNGGAFASTLAKQTALYQSQLEPQVYQAEASDLKSVDSAYGANSNSYLSAISGGPMAQYNGARQDAASAGGFANSLINAGFRAYGNRQDAYGNPAGSEYGTDYSSPVRDNLGIGR